MALSNLPLRQMDYLGRINLLRQAGLLTGDLEQGFLLSGDLTQLEVGQLLAPTIENCIGVMPVPVGLATNFVINGQEVLVPIATEERGIIAGCSKAAKLCRPAGFEVSGSSASTMTGQILFSGYVSVDEAIQALDRLKQNAEQLLSKCFHELPSGQRLKLINQTCNLVPHHGARSHKIVVNLIFETGESMGAGQVTRQAERAAKALQRLAGWRSNAAICSNMDAGWLMTAKAFWPLDLINLGTAHQIIDLQEWAEQDPKRTPTHNKGILNAMECVALATGQDFRAVGAAAWAYAHKGNFLRPLTEYRIIGQRLEGKLVVRIPVGVCGGATEGTFAKAYRQLTEATTAKDLADRIAVAGLAANFGALHCLAKEGISVGHARTKQE